MDEDLKIVISTELDADPEKSANRIRQRLPDIEKKLANDRVRIVVGIDDSNVKSQANQIANTVQQTVSQKKISLNIDTDRIKLLKDTFAKEHIFKFDTEAFAEDIRKAGLEVKKLENTSGAFGKSFTVSLSDGIGKLEERVYHWHSEMTDAVTGITTPEHWEMFSRRQVEDFQVVENLQKRISAEQERAAKAAVQAADQRQQFLMKEVQLTHKLWDKQTGADGSNAIVDEAHLEEINRAWEAFGNEAIRLSQETGKMTGVEKQNLSNLRAELERLINTYQKAANAATDLRTRGVDTSKSTSTSDLLKFERDLERSGLMTENFKEQVAALKVELNNVADGDGLQAFLDKFEVVKARVQAFKSDAGLADKISDVNAKLETTRATVETIQHRAAALSNPTENLKVNVSELAGLLEAVDKADTDSGRIRAFNELQKKIRDCRTELTALNQSQNLGVRDVRFTSGLEKAKSDLVIIARTWSAFKSDPGLNRQFEQLQANLRAVNDQPGLTKWTAQFNAFKSEIKAAGLNVQSLGDTMKNNLGKVMQWVSATTMLFRAIRLLKNAIDTVVDLDTAMIDLRKTTNATEAEYQRFYKTANETAKRLNVTTEAVISQSAAWSRLGYDIQTASKLAEASSILKMISPQMTEDQAQSGLVSIIKAYGYDDMDNILDDIISKINIIGNTKALSNVDIVEILTRSSAAMAAANNTLEETISLGVAAQEIVQSAEVVGTGLRTLSLRIRGYDESTEEYSDDVAMLTGKIADMTKTAKTAGGISLFEADNPDQYKSTYQILKEISEIWDDLTDKNQAQLLEALFGKRQAQIGAAILTNFEQAEKSMEDMQNAAGNAEAEMSVIMDSIEYRLNALGQTWVGVSQSLFNKSTITSAIDILQALSDVVAAITDKFGLLGTIGIGGFSTALYQLIKSAGATTQSISNVVIHFERLGATFNGGIRSLGQYAIQLQSLNGVQRAVAMNALGLNNEQQSQITAFIKATAVCDGLTLAEILGAEATKKQKQQTDRLTQSQLLQLAVSGKMDQKLRDAILRRGAEVLVTDEQRAAQDRLNISLKEYLAMQWQTAAGKIAIVTAALSALVMVGTFAYNTWKQHHDKLISDAVSAASTFENTTKSISEYQQKILDLKKALADENITEQEAYDKRKQLLDIKDEVVSAYGDEAKAIDILGESADKTNKKLSEITKTLAGRYLRENSQAIEEAENALANPKWMNAGIDSFSAASEKARAEIEEVIGRFGAELGSTTQSGEMHYFIRQFTSGYEFIDTLDDIGEAIDAIKRKYKDAGEEIPTIFDEINADIGATQKRIESQINGSEGQILNQAIQWRIITDDTYSAINQQIEDVQEKYKDVIAKGDEDAAVAAISALSNIDLSDVTNVSVQRFFEDFIEKVESEAQKTVVRVKVKTEIESSDKNSNLQFGLSQLSSADRAVRLSDIRSAEQSLQSSAGSRGVTRAENGYALLLEEAEKYGIEVEDLIDILVEQGVVLDDMGEKAQQAAKDAMPLADVVNKFAETEEGINKLSTALKEFSDDGTVSIKTLDGIGQEMGNLDSFEEFYATMLDGNATMEQAQAITNKLAGEYIDSAEALKKLTDGYSDEVVATLKRLGVINAEEVVESRLAQERVNAKVSALGLADAEWKVAEAELQAVGASQAEIDALKALRLKKLDEMISSQDFVKTHNSVTEAMLQAAAAAGVEAEAIAKLNEIKALEKLIEIETDDFGIKSMKQSVSILKNQVRGEIERAIADVNVRTDIPINANITQSGSSSSSSKSTDRYFTEIDRFREYIKAVNDAQEEAEQLNGILGRVGALERQADLHEQLAGQYDIECTALHALNEERRKAIQEGVDILNGAGLNAEYDPQANDLYIRDLERINELVYKDIPYGMRKFEYDSNGRMNFLGGNYDNQTEALNNYKKQLEGLASTISGWNDDAKDDSENWFTAFDSAFENRINSYEKRAKALENLITLNTNWQENAIAGRDYADVREYTDNIIDAYRKMQEQINAEAEAYRAKGYSDTSDEVSQLSDLWWQYQEEIENATKNAWDAVVSNANDALGEIQGVYDTLKQAAKEYSESGGYITIDTYQEVLAMGPKYLSMLQDENGELKINEQRIQAVIQARAEELGLEQAIAYVEELRAAKNDPKRLADLTRAIREETTARWDLVKAELASLNLNEQDYKAALANIEAIEALTVGAVDGINKSLSGTSELMDYVMDMVKQEVEDQIDNLEEMKSAYSEIIDLEKKRLQNAKDENDYQKDMASRMKEIAKLTAKADALKLAADSGDRKAAAERASILEQIQNLQDDVADKQAEHSLEKNQEMLDQMESDYHDEKDKEIKKLEDSIASKERLYRKALDRIENRYETLYNDLVDWNERAGASLEYEISDAWEVATNAAKGYYDYVNGQALANTIDNYYRGGSSSSGDGSPVGSNGTVAKKSNVSKTTAQVATQAVGAANETEIRHWVKVMQENSADWPGASNVERMRLEKENQTITDKYLPDLGLTGLHRGNDGVWYLKDGRKLYDVYGGYHEGGFVSGKGEQLGLLKGGEFVLTEQMIANLTSYFNKLKKLGEGIIGAPALIRNAFTGDGFKIGSNTNISNISNTDNRPVEISMGPTYIYGVEGDTVKQHERISRDQMNQIAKYLGVKQ